MFDLNIISELLLTVPFFIGYTRPKYDSQAAQLEAFLRSDMYAENVREQREWEEYQEKQAKENEKSGFAKLAGALVGAAIGFTFGGVNGAKLGWNTGKGLGSQIRQADSEYFDGASYLQKSKYLRGGKFNKTVDHLKFKEALNNAKEFNSLNDMNDFASIAKGAFIGLKTDWSEFNYKDWKELTYSQQFKELINSFKVNKLKDFTDSRDKKIKEITKAATDPSGYDPSVQPVIDPELIAGDFGVPATDIDKDIEEQLDKEIKKVVKEVAKDPGKIIPPMANFQYDPSTGGPVPKKTVGVLPAKEINWKPFDQDWRRENDKFIWEDWFQNREVRPAEELGQLLKTGAQKTGQGIKTGIDLFGQGIQAGGDLIGRGIDKGIQAWQDRPRRLQKAWRGRQLRPIQSMMENLSSINLKEAGSAVFGADNVFEGNIEPISAASELGEEIEIPEIKRPEIEIKTEDLFFDDDISYVNPTGGGLEDFDPFIMPSKKASTLTEGGYQEAAKSLDNINPVDKTIKTAVRIDESNKIYKGVLNETEANNKKAFNTVFGIARDAGVALFYWKGKAYTTEREGDVDYQADLGGL